MSPRQPKSHASGARKDGRDDPRTVGVIELGTTSIRMVVAEVPGKGDFRILDSLQRPVSLGKDTFTRGLIDPGTTEECVSVLRSFLHVLEEYGVTDERRVSLVATSAVREAANREAFLDRMVIATGIQVDVLNEAEVSRLTYLAVRPLLDDDPQFGRTDTVVIEVGGGSTETLVFRKGKVFSAHMYRLGSLRLRGLLADTGTPRARTDQFMSHYVRDTAERISATVSPASPVPLRMLALGSEARFACNQIQTRPRNHGPNELSVKALSDLTAEVLDLSVDALVRRYRLTYPEAETLGPALMVYAQLARALKLRSMLVGEATLRSGILADISTRGAWTPEFKRQIVNSANAIGRKYKIDMRHARNVARFSQRIFESMPSEHKLGARYELILYVAALLHECGYYVNNSSHHKHSFYLILNSDIFGLGSKDLLFAALVARYHRGAMPRPTHAEFMSLVREDRIVVSKMAAILRVANALDREGSHHRRRCRVLLEPGLLAIELEGQGDLSLERHRMRERAVMFEQVYGLRVEVRPMGAEE